MSHKLDMCLKSAGPVVNAETNLINTLFMGCGPTSLFPLREAQAGLELIRPGWVRFRVSLRDISSD